MNREVDIEMLDVIYTIMSDSIKEIGYYLRVILSKFETILSVK